MTDLILYSKPFDWNDNLSEEAIEDFETIRGKLTYCTHQSIGMALAKLELLEKQGYKVIDSSVSSSEKPNKCEDVISRQAVLDKLNRLIEVERLQGTDEMGYGRERVSAYESMIFEIESEYLYPSVTPQPKSEWQQDHEILKAYSDGASAVLESIKYLIEQYEHYLELLDADMKDGSATIVTKTKYAVYTDVVEQLKEVLESEVQS